MLTPSIAAEICRLFVPMECQTGYDLATEDGFKTLPPY
jgi:hypothetical protein